MGEAIHHWTALRKMELVTDVRRGRVDREAVLRQHGISAEEFDSWAASLDAFGLGGLRTGHARLSPEPPA